MPVSMPAEHTSGQSLPGGLAGGEGFEPLFTESESDLGKIGKKFMLRQGKEFTARI